MRKRIVWIAACAWLMLMLAGCSLRSPEELYTLPRPSAEYESLQSGLDELLAKGYEYAAPNSGSNTQSVQMEDLDGDGVDEAVAFFRNSSGEEHPMKICVFRVDEEGDYDLAVTIEGDGDAISSAVYCQLNDHTDSRGNRTEEIVVGWQMSGTVYALSAYSIENDNVSQLMSVSGYSRYAVCDMDQDGLSEIIVMMQNTAEGGGNTAEYYDWSEEDALMQINTVSLSASMESVSTVQTGYLTDHVPALYVTGTDREVGTLLLTDILTVQDGTLVNLTLDSGSGDSNTGHSASMALTDINGDMALDVPMSLALNTSDQLDHSEFFTAVQWIQYGADGRADTVAYTYHNTADGWYFTLDEDWLDGLILNRGDSNVGATVERSVTFYRQEEGDLLPFLVIYKNTGSNRDSRAVIGDRFLLCSDGEATYSAELPECAWDSGLTENDVTDRFSLITTDWSTE